MNTAPVWVAVGSVRKPFGLKGEVSVEVFGETADRFRPGREVWLNLRGTRRRLVAAGLRVLPDKTLVSFEGVTRNDVETWRGAVFEVSADSLPEIDGGYYYYELLGLEVLDARGGRVGIVSDVREVPSGTLLTVRGEGREHLIPYAEALVDVDLEKRVLKLADVEGLLEL